MRMIIHTVKNNSELKCLIRFVEVNWYNMPPHIILLLKALGPDDLDNGKPDGFYSLRIVELKGRIIGIVLAKIVFDDRFIEPMLILADRSLHRSFLAGRFLLTVMKELDRFLTDGYYCMVQITNKTIAKCMKQCGFRYVGDVFPTTTGDGVSRVKTQIWDNFSKRR